LEKVGGDLLVLEDGVLLDYGHSLSLLSGSRTREAASVPRDARVLLADLHLAAVM
jgi:hypothetical protein